MEYTKEEFNKVTIQTLKSRGDHISLNAVKMIEEMQEQAINYTQCCESHSELLHTEVFNLANKLAINGYGNEAVKMHQIGNGM